MTCEEAVKKLYEYIDKELDHATAQQIEKHLELCQLCCNHMEFEKKMKSLVQESCFREKAPPFLKDKILGTLDSPE